MVLNIDKPPRKTFTGWLMSLALVPRGFFLPVGKSIISGLGLKLSLTLAKLLSFFLVSAYSL